MLNILDFVKSNRKRHEVIEAYLLNCDRDTIATEVPIYYYDKKLGSVSGHIDMLQIKNNKVYILDYKPDAAKENKQKVTTQLNLYALALSFRTNIHLSKIICGYFDESDYFEFFPNNLF